jgi:putative ABC transport system ATP-binding protein
MLQLKEISKVYGEGATRVVALDKISFKADEGHFVAVMGPSGSGKSTFLNIIGGLDRPSSGEVILEGDRIDDLDENELVDVRRGKIAYVFQQYHLLPSLTALENVLLPLVFCGARMEEGRALEILEKVGLGKRTGHKPGQLSGGEQQRVAIARALVSRPSLILADEPTGNMDRKTGGEIMRLFEQLHNEGHGIIMVTHDPEIADFADSTVFLQDGRIVKEKEAKIRRPKKHDK